MSKPIIVGIVVVVVLVLGTGGWFYFSSQSQPREQTPGVVVAVFLAGGIWKKILFNYG